jgi:hypothetical protein
MKITDHLLYLKDGWWSWLRDNSSGSNLDFSEKSKMDDVSKGVANTIMPSESIPQKMNIK